jgi:CheY-like chemotaxis protein
MEMAYSFKWKMVPAVLIADDSPVNRKIMASLLQQCGCSVSVAVDGEELLQQFNSGSWNLVFVDVNMPGIDGLEATATIRELEKQRNPPNHIPIIALTAGIMPDEQRKCYEAGMDEIIAKPLSMENLCSVLKNKLSHLLD